MVVRGEKVILDSDLAALLYGAETRRLNEQLLRNIDKFPEDFMFQLTREFDNLKLQIATSSFGWAFVRLREMILTNEKLSHKLDDLEKRVSDHDEILIDLIREIRKLIDDQNRKGKRRLMGFILPEKEDDKL